MESTDSHLQETSSHPTVFRREGEYWMIVYDGVVCRLKDIKGLRHLASLLRQPGTPVAALELSGGARRHADGAAPQGEPPSRQSAERARLTVTKAIKAALAKICAHHPTLGQHLTATIRRGCFCSYTPDPRHPIYWET
jgi:hypothetical protein